MTSEQEQSTNARRHMLTAQKIALNTEEQPLFDAMTEGYMDLFQPINLEAIDRIHTTEPKPDSPIHGIYNSEPKPSSPNHRIYTTEPKPDSPIHRIYNSEPIPDSPNHWIYTTEPKPT
jgi:hypothetical protein